MCHNLQVDFAATLDALPSVEEVSDTRQKIGELQFRQRLTGMRMLRQAFRRVVYGRSSEYLEIWRLNSHGGREMSGVVALLDETIRKKDKQLADLREALHATQQVLATR